MADQTDPNIAILERRHRQRARVEDRIRDDKDTGLAKLPFKQFALNEVWSAIVMLAHDLIVWTQALCLDDELAKAEPKRLRYRLLHLAARLASPAAAGAAPPGSLALDRSLKAAFEKLNTVSRRDRLNTTAADIHPPSRPPRPPALITAARTTPTTRPTAPREPPRTPHQPPQPTGLTDTHRHDPLAVTPDSLSHDQG